VSFVAKTQKKYDLVLLDAYTEHGIAKSVGEEDFIKCCWKIIQQDGLVVSNLHQSPQESFKRSLETYKKLFDPVMLLRAKETVNIVLVGMMNKQILNIEEIKKVASSVSDTIGKIPWSIRDTIEYGMQVC